jgi:hypothetical protein
MDAWGALRYVETGLSLVAFAIAAFLFAYRTRLARRAEIIKSAPKKQRLEAIATTAEFFRIDVSGLTRAQQRDIALAQIHARARRDRLLAGVSFVVATSLALIAVVSVSPTKPAGPAVLIIRQETELRRGTTRSLMLPPISASMKRGSANKSMMR